MKFLDPSLWLALLAIVIVSALSGFAYGVHVTHMEQAQQLATDTQVARDIEGELQRLQNHATTAYIDRTEITQEKAHALPKITLAADCRVPAAVGGVLNAAQHLSGNAGAGPDIGAAGTAVDSTCAAELDIAKRNYAEVCEPNAAQLTEIQVRWEMVRAAISPSNALNSGSLKEVSQ